MVQKRTDGLTPEPEMYRGRLGRRGFLTLGAAGALSLTVPGLVRAAGSVKLDRPMKIGFVVPLTGPTAAEGEAMRRGFDLGIKALNDAGGVGGHPVEIVMQDSQSTPSVSATIAEKFVQQDKVDLIVGTVSYDEANVVTQLATALRTPFMTLENGFADPICQSTAITLGETLDQMLDPLIPFLIPRNGKKWALIGSDYYFPHAYIAHAKELLKDTGVEIVAEEYVPLGSTNDWSPIISKLVASEPDLVLSGVVGGDAIAFIKAGSSLGFFPKTKVSGVSLQPEFYPALGSAIDGMYCAARYSTEIPTKSNADFIEAYQTAYGEGPIPFIASTAFYAPRFIRAAVENAGGAHNHAKLLKGFDGASATTLLSDKPLVINAGTRDINYPMYICEVQKGGIWHIVEETGPLPTGIKC